MRVRVVWGLSETMASLVPTMRLSRDDLPAFGRPTNETKPALTSFPRVPDLFRLIRFGSRRARHPHFANTAALRIDDLDVQAVDVERLSDCGHVTEMAQ